MEPLTVFEVTRRPTPLTCPFCREALDDDVWECPLCFTPHHRECAREHGGCTLLGCDQPRLAAPEPARDEPSPRATVWSVASLQWLYLTFAVLVVLARLVVGAREMGMGGLVVCAAIALGANVLAAVARAT